MKAIVIGAGLGGLLSAARLSKAGYSVEVFERLPLPGGRFTNLNYKGFQLSSGAFHIIPHGPAGPLANFLKEIGAEVEIVRSEQTELRVPLEKGDTDYEKGFKDIPFPDFSTLLSRIDRIKIALLIVSTRKNHPSGTSLQVWIKSKFKDEWLIRFADAFCGWALSLKSDEVPVEEVFEIIENMYRYGGPGVPIGGCKGVIDALETVISSNEGKIYLNSEVSKILAKNGKATGVLVAGKEHEADLVISDIGHAATSKLCLEALSEIKALDYNKYADYFQMLETLQPSAGIKICLSASEPLIGHSGVLLTPYAKRVNGINEVTEVDPKLAPQGKHLTMSHQHVAPENINDLESEIKLGLQDLKEIFPDKKYEVLLIQSYHDDWPVNRAASGMDSGNETPVTGLYVVGDGAKGKGGIEVEGVTLGVTAVMKKILG